MTDFLQTWADQYPWLRADLFGNPAWTWVAAAITALVVFTVLRVARWALTRVVGDPSRDRSRLGLALVLGRAFVQATRDWALLLIAIGVGVPWLALGQNVERVWTVVLTLGVFVQIGLWAGAVLRAWLDRVITTRAAEDPAMLTSFAAFRFLGMLIVWSAVLLLSLDNLGVDVTALVAGFGIGGIAVALAAQNLLGDLFASLSIILDRPFEVGDFIIVGDKLGVVESIGLKTTRVRSLGGEQITFGNTDLLSSRIHNYKRMRERRVSFELAVVHDTPTAKLEQVPELAKRSIEGLQNTRFDRAHMKQIAPTALVYEIVYYIGTNDYNAYMDIQQAINFDILRGLEERGVALAHPTYTVRLHRETGNGTGPVTADRASTEEAS